MRVKIKFPHFFQPNPYLNSVYAVGTYGKTVGVYLEPRGQALCLLEGQRGGVTHAQFTPDGSKLLVGGRRDPEVLVWDMRNPGRLYASLRREAATNQRMYFDVHPSNSRWVVGGTTGGEVHVWDLLSSAAAQSEPESVAVLEPTWSSSRLHTDCVNGASFHPSEPIFVRART